MLRGVVTLLGLMIPLGFAAGCSSGGSTPAEDVPASDPVACISTATDSNDVGLRGARLRLVEDGIEVTWTLKQGKAIGDVGYSVELTDEYGALYRELSLFFVDEAFAEVLGTDWLASVKIFNQAGDEFIEEPAPTVDGRTVTMVFPRAAVEGSTNVTHWRASAGAAVDGVDRTDWCPDPSQGDDFPESVALPQ